jgi:hypothetical protein
MNTYFNIVCKLEEKRRGGVREITRRTLKCVHFS